MSLGQKIAHKSIELPANPFWEVTRTFGRDEIYAGILSLVVTAILEWFFFVSGTVIAGNVALLLVLAGPIAEKFGFFIGHAWDARKEWNQTPQNERRNFAYYAKKAFHGGFKSLIQDILVHDPIYVILMFGGIWLHPQTPVWLLVPVAFGVAVIAVAFLEVGFSELRYYLFKRRLFKLGFDIETYNEARFYVELSDINPKDVIEDLRDQFIKNNDEIYSLAYEDRYYDHNLPEFNGRGAIVRVRERERGDKSKLKTVQVVYTKANEHSEDDHSQFRFFPQRKNKIYYMLNKDEEHPLVAAHKKNIEKALTSLDKPLRTIQFHRFIAVSSEELFVSVDVIDSYETPYAVIEIKAYVGREDLMIQAMRYIMTKYPVVQITHNKLDLSLKEETNA